MGRMSREKGRRAEIELCKLLSAELGQGITRNVDQARKGGADCLQVQGFAIQIKRQEKLARPAWWAQTVQEAQVAGAEPLCFYRRSHEPWQALIRTADGGYREATFEQAVYHIREKWSCWP